MKDHLASWRESADTAINVRRTKVIGGRIYDTEFAAFPPRLRWQRQSLLIVRGILIAGFRVLKLVATHMWRTAVALPCDISLRRCRKELAAVALLPKNGRYRRSKQV
jgi:hypothetical protein